MRVIKSKAKQYKMAALGVLFYIEDGRYVHANVGIVIAQHGKITFYARRA